VNVTACAAVAVVAITASTITAAASEPAESPLTPDEPGAAVPGPDNAQTGSQRLSDPLAHVATTLDPWTQLAVDAELHTIAVAEAARVEAERVAAEAEAAAAAARAARGRPVFADTDPGPVLARIRACESGGNYAAIGGPGGIYRGAYQFLQATWEGVGGTGDPAAATPAEQDLRAAILYAQSGPAPWPICGRS
jgi:Transglycosylase-like domain